MSNTIRLTIEVKYDGQETTVEVQDPTSLDQIKEAAADEFNLVFDDNETETPAEADTVEISVKDWDETPEKLRELDNDFFEFIEHYQDSSYDVEVFEAAYNLDIPFSDIDEAYQGKHDSDQDFAQYVSDGIGAIPKNAQWPMNCIDWEFAAKELMYDYCEDNGHYFRNL